MPSPKPGLRELKKARTRAAIQTHALRLFRERGYDLTTIQQIISAAEVSETTFFRYFPTKEDVVLQDDLDPLIFAALRAQPPGLPPLTAVRAAFAEFFATLTPAQLAETAERIALVNDVPALRAAMLDQYAQALLRLADALAERTGRPAADLAVRTVAGAVIGSMMGVLTVLADDPAASLPSLLDEALSHLEAGLPL